MVIDITEAIHKNSGNTDKKTQINTSPKFYDSFREELANFYMITPSNFHHEEIENFEYVIGEILKIQLLAQVQLQQSAKHHEQNQSFFYYINNGFHEFQTAEDYIHYLHNDSNYARSLTDAFQDNNRMRDVIFHFMDTAQKRLSQIALLS